MATQIAAMRQQQTDLAERVFDAVDIDLLRSPQGIALSEVPPELQELLIRNRQDYDGIDVALSYTYFQRIMEANPYLRLGKLAPETPRLWTAKISDHSPGDFAIRLMVEGNREVASLFEAPTSSDPNAVPVGGADEELEQMRRVADEKERRLRNRILHPEAP